MTYLQEMDAATGFLDASRMAEKGRELTADYNAGNPFSHTVIDDFLPRSLIDLCIAEFDCRRCADQTVYGRAQERLKREYKPDELSHPVRTLFYSFNSQPFIRLIENITGIKGLVPDPYFLGGGFHEIETGGHLSVHTDFNYHKPLNLERRINVLVYLNDDWKDEYGGQLELWDNDMRHCVQSIVPLANRCVIFNTTSSSNHGNPQPVNHPQGIARRSIALYYYTATWARYKRSHTTQFRPRTGTRDQPDWEVRRRELLEDLVPPMVLRAVAKAGRGIRKLTGEPSALKK